MMRGSRGFACPSLSSFFKTSPPTDPAVLDVARAIYAGGRAGGLPGLEAVAHVIQNRMSHPSFPQDPQAVITAGTEQFTRLPRGFAGSSGATKEPVCAADRQLFEQARKMAAQLVHPPRRLSSRDPTGGAIYYDERAPQRLHSASRPLGRAAAGSSGVGVTTGPHLSIPPQPHEPDAVVAEESMAASVTADLGSGRSSSPPPPIPPTNQRPPSFLRDRRVAGLPAPRHRQSLDGDRHSIGSSVGGESPAQRAASTTSGAGVGGGGVYQPPPRPPAGPSIAAAHLSPAASGGGMWSAPPTPPSPPHPARAPPTSPSPLPGAQASSSSSSGGQTVASARLPPRMSMGSLARGHDDRERRRNFADVSEGGGPRMTSGRGGISAPRPLAGVSLGPRDFDGYHDVILPCGLLQDEVIELMYRDLSPEDFEMLTKLDERVAPRNTAQRNSVERLPRVPVKDCGCTECGVCLQDFDPLGTVVQLPCRHSFHPPCISRWLTQCKNTCPLCSAPIGHGSTTTSC